VDEAAVMTLQDVADYLNCHHSTAFKLAKRGDIPSFRVGGGWRFLKSDVDKWIAKGDAMLAGSTHGGRRGRKPKPKS
jgi:excisionase family DNA binding protein